MENNWKSLPPELGAMRRRRDEKNAIDYLIFIFISKW